MYDVALIHPPRVPRFSPQGNQFPIMPVGLMSIAGELRRAGFSVKIFNLAMQAAVDPGFNLRSAVKRIDAKVYGIDFHWFVHAHGYVAVADVVKSVRPDSKVVVGGMSASWFARDVISEKSVDVVVLGEGEQAMRETVDAFESGKSLSDIRGIAYKEGKAGSPKFTAARTPVPFEAFSNYDFTSLQLIDDYQAYITMGAKPANFWLPIARACPFNCAYCGGSREGYAAAMGRTATVFREVEAVVQDVEKLTEQGVRVVNFTHDPEIGGKRYWEPLFKSLSSRVPDVGVYIEAFRSPSREFMQAVKGLAGSSLAISPESASEEVRRFVGREMSDQQIFSSLSSAKELSIPVLVYFLVGLPRETWDTFALFEPMVKKIMSEKLGLVVPPIPYTVDPNSPMALRPEDYGVKLLANSYQDYRRMAASNEEKDWIAHETKWLSRDEIYGMLTKAREIVMRYYGNPRLVTFG